MPTADGLTLPFDTDASIRCDLLDVFPYDGHPQKIEYTTAEFSAVCPFSGLPDYGRLTIVYEPMAHIVELKSLKYYIVSFRNVGMYQEHITNRLYQDLHQLLTPNYLNVTTSYNTRGGIDTTCTVESPH